jgi:hypothetical protein
MVKKYVCIPRNFLVIKVCNQGKIYAHSVYIYIYICVCVCVCVVMI